MSQHTTIAQSLFFRRAALSLHGIL